MLRIRSPQDLGAAVVFVAIGLAGAYFGRDLAFGSAGRMGPGYFPAILSWAIVGVGIIVGLQVADDRRAAHRAHSASPDPGHHRRDPAVRVSDRCRRPGDTAVLLTVLAAYARRDVSLGEALLLGVGLAAFTVIVFVYGLSQPLPAWWGR